MSQDDTSSPDLQRMQVIQQIKERDDFVQTMATRDPWVFISEYCNTLDEHDEVTPVKPFPRFQVLRSLVSWIQRYPVCFVPKSRQVRVTWTMCAYYLWKCMFKPGRRVFFKSKKEEDADGNLQRVLWLYKNLPEKIQKLCPAKYKYCHMVFDNFSQIHAVSQNPDAIAQYTASDIFDDEMALQPDAEAAWIASLPTVKAGGRYVGVSSARDNSFFQKITDNAKGRPQDYGDTAPLGSWNHEKFRGGTGEFPVFRLHYSSQPDRDEVWLKEAQAGYRKADGTLKPSWYREYEIDFCSTTDFPIFEGFTEAVNVRDLGIFPTQIYRCWDFGYHHPAVVWQQCTPQNALYCLAAYMGNDLTLDEFVEDVKKFEQVRFPTRPRMKDVCDPAGKQRSDKGEYTSVDILRKHGVHALMKKVPPRVRLHMMVNLLHAGRLFVHPSCGGFEGSLIAGMNGGATWKHVRDIVSDEMERDGLYEHCIDASSYGVPFMFPLSLAQDGKVSAQEQGTLTYGDLLKKLKTVEAGKRYGRTENSLIVPDTGLWTGFSWGMMK